MTTESQQSLVSVGWYTKPLTIIVQCLCVLLMVSMVNRLFSWLPVGCYGVWFLGNLFVIMELVVLDNCLLLWSFFLGYLLVVMGLYF